MDKVTKEIVITDVNMETVRVEPSKTYTVEPFNDKDLEVVIAHA